MRNFLIKYKIWRQIKHLTTVFIITSRVLAADVVHIFTIFVKFLFKNFYG